MNYQQLEEAGITHVALKHKEGSPSHMTIWKMRIIKDKESLLEGYTFDHIEGKASDIAVFVQE